MSNKICHYRLNLSDVDVNKGKHLTAFHLFRIMKIKKFIHAFIILLKKKYPSTHMEASCQFNQASVYSDNASESWLTVTGGVF